MTLRVTGVDTGLNGALVTVNPGGSVMSATLLHPGDREDGWTTPSPSEVSAVYMQMRGHLEHAGPGAVVYEQVGATRGVAAARSLFMCEGLLLDICHDLGVPVFGVMQATLRAWVAEHLGISKWTKGMGKQQVADAMDPEVVACMDHHSNVARLTPARQRHRRTDLADAYLTARWGQHNIQTGGN